MRTGFSLQTPTPFFYILWAFWSTLQCVRGDSFRLTGVVQHNTEDRGGIPEASILLVQMGSSETFTAVSDSTGFFNLSVPEGFYSVQVSAQGYFNLVRKIEVRRDLSHTDRICQFNLIQAFVVENSYHFILTWGADPNLELMLVTPEECVVTPSNSVCEGANGTIAYFTGLRHESYGPESIEILHQPGTVGLYELWVSSSDDYFDEQNAATVAVYSAPGIIGQVTRPQTSSSQKWWKILSVDSSISDSPVIFENSLFSFGPELLSSESQDQKNMTGIYITIGVGCGIILVGILGAYAATKAIRKSRGKSDVPMEIEPKIESESQYSYWLEPNKTESNEAALDVTSNNSNLPKSEEIALKSIISGGWSKSKQKNFADSPEVSVQN